MDQVEQNLESGMSTVPEELPLLPIRDLVVFPFMVVPLFVSRNLSIAAIDDAMAADRLVFMSAQEDPGADEPAMSQIFDVGTVGKILRMRRLPDGHMKVLVQGLRRVRVERVIRERPSIRVKIEPLEDVTDPAAEAELEGLIRVVKESLRRLGESGKALPQDVLTVMLGLSEPGALADLVASNLGLRVPDAQRVLEGDSPVDRLRRVNDALTKEMEVVAWKEKIKTQAKEEMSRAQREYFLREQLKQIKNELGDLDTKAEDFDELKSRLRDALLPQEVEREAAKQLRRLEAMSADSAEASVVRTYLDWILDLPWEAHTPDHFDIKRARRILDEDHFGLDEVKDRILEYLGVLKLRYEQSADQTEAAVGRGPILCFVGPPGVGKTSLGRSIARALNREFVRVSLGGVHDESEIRGHRRTYVGAMPGRIIAGLKQAGTKNPVFLLDELDKLGREGRGDPSAALLEVLDLEQNATFSDHYLNLPFDLSSVLWVATANVASTIPAALRDRVEMIQLSGYDIEEKVEIARRYLIPKQQNASGLSEAQLVLPPDVVEMVVERYTREAGLRGLERQLAKISRKVARVIAEGEDAPARIGVEALEGYLGPRRHDPDRPDEQDRVGLSTGLAWTEVGGSILHVEATLMPGKGTLTLTGQLGNVMKESAHTALSLARSRAASFGLDEQFFKEHDVHLHVPHGAIPKDGPSAGITMASALISLLTGLPIKRDVAMTGEITLRGRVLAVGGLKEKLLAAARAGIKQVIVPDANAPELVEVPDALKEKLAIHVVREIDEVLKIAIVGFGGFEAEGAVPPKVQPSAVGRA